MIARVEPRAKEKRYPTVGVCNIFGPNVFSFWLRSSSVKLSVSMAFVRAKVIFRKQRIEVFWKANE